MVAGHLEDPEDKNAHLRLAQPGNVAMVAGHLEDPECCGAGQACGQNKVAMVAGHLEDPEATAACMKLGLYCVAMVAGHLEDPELRLALSSPLSNLWQWLRGTWKTLRLPRVRAPSPGGSVATVAGHLEDPEVYRGVHRWRHMDVATVAGHLEDPETWPSVVTNRFGCGAPGRP